MKKSFWVAIAILFVFCCGLAAQGDKPAVEPHARGADGPGVFAGRSDLPYPGPCPKCFEFVRNNQKRIRTEFKKAINEFPALCYSYILLVDHQEFMNEFGFNGGLAGWTPDPEGGGGEEIVGPLEYWNWFHQERRDLLERLKSALADFGVEEEPHEIDHKWNYCNDLERQYAQAQECVLQFLENPPQTEEEWERYQECLETIQNYINARDYCAAYW